MLAALIASLALFVWHPVWLTPPLVTYTPLVYLLAWVPVWAIIALWKKPGRRMWRALLVGAVVITPCWCLIAAPMSGVGMTFEPGSLECVELDAGGGQTRYLCRTSSYRLTLKGPDSWPVARLEDFEGYDSISPPPLPTLTPVPPG